MIHRFDGAAWDAVPVTARDESFRGVWGPSGAELHLVAGDRVYAFDGAAFTSTSLAPTEGRTSLLEVWGRPASSSRSASTRSRSRVGRSCAAGSCGTGGAARGPTRRSSPRTRCGARAPPTCSRSVSALQRTSTARRGPRSRWSPRPSDVWGSGAGDVVMVANGALMRCASPPCVDAASYTSTAASGSFLAVSGSGPSDVFAVGLDGVIHHFDGASWSEQRRGGVHLVGVAARGPTDAYAVGEGGTILVYDGSSWSPAQADLRRPGIAQCPELTAITNAGGELVVVGLADLVARQRP
ncbi:MAG: hypothetical protein M5U28_19610 [Sandaracinaceae bacterium]|nr:hypothetical protein [Sandaracinaceae bacterium]